MNVLSRFALVTDFKRRTKFSFKSVTLFTLLSFLPDFLGFFTFQTGFGFNIHFFQFVIFLMAFVYGVKGGIFAGGLGSIYTAIVLQNPYLIVGNIVLGGMTGLLFRKGFKPVNSAMGAFIIQLPWLVYTDLFLVKLPAPVLQAVIVSLLVSNLVFAFLAGKLRKKAKKFLSFSKEEKQ